MWLLSLPSASSVSDSETLYMLLLFPFAKNNSLCGAFQLKLEALFAVTCLSICTPVWKWEDQGWAGEEDIGHPWDVQKGALSMLRFLTLEDTSVKCFV